MNSPISKPRLSIYGNKDGDQVIDAFGTIYEFNAEQNEWIDKGVIPSHQVVTDSTDGLVSPEVYRKLTLLQDLIRRGFDFSKFKLDSPVDNPYYYLFHSSDDLIRFTPEQIAEPKVVYFDGLVRRVVVDITNNTTSVILDGSNLRTSDFTGLVLESPFGTFNILSGTASAVVVAGRANVAAGDPIKVARPESRLTRLRIEVDRGRLYQKLLRSCCVGPKGSKGDVGDRGTPGLPAESETFQFPISTTGGEFVWNSVVNTPIDTPISLRVYRADGTSPIIEILYPLNSTENTLIVISDDSISIEETSLVLSYDPTSNQFSGSFSVLTDEDISSWRYKARQQGPKGIAGEAGKAFLEIANRLLDDPSLRGTEAILSLRKASSSDDIIFLREELFDEVPVANLSALDGGQVVDFAGDYLVSAQITIREARDIGFFQTEIPEFSIPQLDIPAWTPTQDCAQATKWALYKFDWFNRVDPNYLFNIQIPAKPPEQCCQEDFFFCPNVGDACPVEGQPEPPVPPQVPCVCSCENPIGDEFGGSGLDLPPLDLTDPSTVVSVPSEGFDVGADYVQVGEGGESHLIPDSAVRASDVNVAESVLDGGFNRFNQEIFLCGNGEIRVTLDFDSDVCGGDIQERADCAFVPSEAVSSTFLLEDVGGNAQITSTNMLETNVIPATVVFTVSSEENVKPDVPPETEPGQVAIPATEENVPAEVENPEFVTSEFSVAHLKLSALVNTTGVDYCRGYRITISAKSDRDVCTRTRTWIITDPPGIEIFDPPFVDPSEPSGPTEDLTGSEPPPVVTPPVESFASAGAVISGGATPTEAIEDSSYVLTFGADNTVVSGTGDGHIFVGPGDTKIGVLIKSPAPSQIPLIHDNLQNNVSLLVPQLILNMVDAGYDVNGQFGPGTYVLANDFSTTWSSTNPSVSIRTDNWTDVIAYFSEPEPGGSFVLVIMARLDSSVIHSIGSSVFAGGLLDDGMSEGVLVLQTTLQGDPMGVISDGSIVFGSGGSISIGYSADVNYPTIVITPVGSNPPGSGSGSGSSGSAGSSGSSGGSVGSEPSGGSGSVGSEPPSGYPLEFFDMYSTDQESNATDVTYGFLAITEGVISPTDQIWITFPVGYDVSGVSGIFSGFIGGTSSFAVDGQTVKFIRNGDGANETSIFDVVFHGINNPGTGNYSFSMEIRNSSGVLLAGPETITGFPVSPLINVPVLQIGGQDYPAFQFSLVGAHLPFCGSDHWHASGAVCNLNGGSITDPDPGGCGFGTDPPLATTVVQIYQHEYDEFLASPCP